MNAIEKAFAALSGMDKAVVEMAKAAAALYPDPDRAHDAVDCILDAYYDIHTESLRIIAEAAP